MRNPDFWHGYLFGVVMFALTALVIGIVKDPHRCKLPKLNITIAPSAQHPEY